VLGDDWTIDPVRACLPGKEIAVAKRMKKLDVVALMGVVGAAMCSPAMGQMALPDNEPARPVVNERQVQPAAPEEMISFGIFREPIELTTLITFVGEQLGINIVVKGSPDGEVAFNAPVEVPKSRLINLLDAMLDQYNFTVTFEPATGFYIVQPTADVKPVFGDTLGTTKIIETPNIKPSLLVGPLQATLGGAGASGGGQQGGGSNAIQAIDELGVLIINARSRDIARIEAMVENLIARDQQQQYIRLELDHLAAPTALNRVVGLVGGSSGSTGLNLQGGNNRGGNPGGNQGVLTLDGGTLSNIGDRITVDPQGNALIFRGTRNEIDRVRSLLAVIDVPNTLLPRNYFAGASASQIADIAKRRGLGEVIIIEDSTSTNQFNGFNGFDSRNNQFSTTNDEGQGGPVMVVDTTRGNIIYYGTDEQQSQLAALLDELKTEDERVVIRHYKLDHTDALTVTDLLNSIIKGESQTGESDILSGTQGRANRGFINGFPVFGDEPGAFDPDKITITADESNNQVVINAPIKQQESVEILIDELDQQRPQVYIEAQIVSISDDEDFLLAFETQLNRGDFGLGTNFGLSGRDNFTDAKNVSASLSGLTTALIRSDAIPLIINATQTNTDVRILSTPQLLVNNNEESTIASVSEQPFNEISQGNNGGQNIETFGGFEEAGTTLTVTPSISNGGFIRLVYDIEFSNFTAAQGIEGSPPPRDRNTLSGTATIPSNGTIVLGGITVEDVRDTILKVPFIGDIPLVGELFRRTSKINNRSKLYVFLTPRIMTDPNFNDLKLFSQGPQAEMELEDGLPELEPAIIDTPGSVVDEDDASVSTGAPSMEPAPIEITEVSGS
jgi:type II secretory pathway component GspD/PulD (secretin)